MAPLLHAPTLVPLWFSSPTSRRSVWIHKNAGSVRLFVRGSGRARGRRQLRAIAAIHIRLPEERVGGSCSVSSFFSSRHAEVSERARLDAGARRLGSQRHCRHLWLHSHVYAINIYTINRRYREVPRRPGPSGGLCSSGK